MSDAASFAAVAQLIALITDVKACAKRLDELRATIDAAEKAQAHLAADRDAHARDVAAATTASAAREKSLTQREIDLAIEKADVARSGETLRRERLSSLHKSKELTDAR
jgi:hypothetical protein